jgi:LPPG:FO 2-phospho-L-lactate transferase
VKVVALAGGTGSAKLLRGLCQLPINLTVVANVGDNFWSYGVYVCPDIDIATYTLAGIADDRRGWGIAGDTFGVLTQLSRFGIDTWFGLGDMDLALSLFRTELMRKGASLTVATDRVRRGLKVRCPILPMSDDPIETRVVTSKKDCHLQEFWVRDRGRPRVMRVYYRGAKSARPTDGVASAISKADRIVLCPANPITSIGPMLAVPGFTRALSNSDARVVALSPMEGNAPFSGPAGKLMKSTGLRPDSVGVAQSYAGFLDCLLISDKDSEMRGKIEALGVGCVTSNTRLTGPPDELRLAKVLIEL